MFFFSLVLSICVFVPCFAFHSVLLCNKYPHRDILQLFNFWIAASSIRRLKASHAMERENTIIRENTYKQEIRDFLLLFFRWTQYFFFLLLVRMILHLIYWNIIGFFFSLSHYLLNVLRLIGLFLFLLMFKQTNIVSNG